MAENNDLTETDVSKQQIKTIETLIDVLEKQGTQSPQVVYATPAAQPKKTPNYALYIGLAILGILIFRSKIL